MIVKDKIETQLPAWRERARKLVKEHGDVKVGEVKNLRNIVYEKISANPQLIVDLKIDRLAEMAKVNDVHQELRKASAIRINYSALPGD